MVISPLGAGIRSRAGKAVVAACLAGVADSACVKLGVEAVSAVNTLGGIVVGANNTGSLCAAGFGGLRAAVGAGPMAPFGVVGSVYFAGSNRVGLMVAYIAIVANSVIGALANAAVIVITGVLVSLGLSGIVPLNASARAITIADLTPLVGAENAGLTGIKAIANIAYLTCLVVVVVGTVNNFRGNGDAAR